MQNLRYFQQADLSRLSTLLSENQDFLLEHFKLYITDSGSDFLSPLSEIEWQKFINSISDALIDTFTSNSEQQKFGGDHLLKSNEKSKFLLHEAKRYQMHGNSLVSFITGMKYCRQTYLDLLNDNKTEFSQIDYIHNHLERSFDHFDVTIADAWANSIIPPQSGKFQNTDQDLLKQKNRYLHLFDSLSDPIIVIDTSLCITELNQSAAELIAQSGVLEPVFPTSSTQRRNENRHQSYLGENLQTALPWLPNLNGEIRSLSQNEDRQEFSLSNPDNQSIFHITLSRSKALQSKQVEYLLNFKNITHQVHMENALGQSTQLQNKMFANMHDAAFIIDGKTIEIIECNTAAENIFGYEKSEMIGNTTAFLHVSEESLTEFREALFPAIQKNGFLFMPCFYMKRKDQSVFPTELSTIPLYGPNQEIMAWISLIRDITEIKQAEISVRESEERLRLFMDSVNESFLIFDENLRCIEVNLAGEEHFQLPKHRLIGQPLTNLVPNGNYQNQFEIYREVIDNKTDITVTSLVKHPRMGDVSYEIKAYPVGNGLGVIIRDNTDQMIYEDYLEHTATHDILTSLPNRVLFTDRLKHAFTISKRNKNPFALLFIDLDDFKLVNDRHGHDIGDLVLRNVAKRLLESVRESDTVARLGGDEFLVLLETVAKPIDAATVAQKIINNFSKPFEINGTKFDLTMSIGISIYPDNGKNAEEMIQKADTAMYQAKNISKNAYFFYNAEMEQSK
jgi:diguanylate cyclase (GGDEF)-like protein/PAS domain S-box-containing protein